MIFTAGGTESDNLAVKGIYWARRDAEPRHRRIVTTEVEHHAVLDSVNWLVEHEGAEVTWLPTAADGSVSAAALRDALQRHDDVALVSVMWANNEVGTDHADRRTRRRRSRIRRPDAQRRGSGGGTAARRLRAPASCPR